MCWLGGHDRRGHWLVQGDEHVTVSSSSDVKPASSYALVAQVNRWRYKSTPYSVSSLSILHHVASRRLLDDSENPRHRNPLCRSGRMTLGGCWSKLPILSWSTIAKLEEITVQKLKPEGEDATSELMRYHA